MAGSMPVRSQAGFTLVEVLIALTIFASIAVSGVVILRLSINSNEQLAGVSDLSGEFQTARSLIKADLSQVVWRRARDEYGNVLPGPMAGGAFEIGGFEQEEDGERLLMAIVTNGNVNPGLRYPRSSLQYVEYLQIADAIVRRTRRYPDALEETPSTQRVMFAGVENVQMRFLYGDRWEDRWLSAPNMLTPDVVELSFDHPRLGTVSQLFLGAGLAAGGSGEAA